MVRSYKRYLNCAAETRHCLPGNSFRNRLQLRIEYARMTCVSYGQSPVWYSIACDAIPQEPQRDTISIIFRHPNISFATTTFDSGLRANTLRTNPSCRLTLDKLRRNRRLCIPCRLRCTRNERVSKTMSLSMPTYQDRIPAQRKAWVLPSKVLLTHPRSCGSNADRRRQRSDRNRL